MHPTIDLSWIEIDEYSAFVGLGVLAGLAIAFLYLRTRSRRASAPGPFVDCAFVTLAAGWLGARAYHIAMHWEYYAARPEEITQVGLGGLAVRGGVLLGLLALLLFARVRRISAGYLLDAAALGLAIGQAIGWAGALVQGAYYGIPSDSQFAVELPDVYGLVELRFPVQQVEIALYAVLFVWLLVLAAQRRRTGTLVLTYLIVSSLANVAIGFQRGDDTAYWGTWRVDQVIDLAAGLIAIGGLLWQWIVGRAGVIKSRSTASLGG